MKKLILILLILPSISFAQLKAGDFFVTEERGLIGKRSMKMKMFLSKI